MAVDDALAGRVRAVLAPRGDVSERRMFGGLAFMVGGHMACGVIGGELMVRVGPDGYDAAMARPHVRAMDFTHRPLRGMVFVGPSGLEADGDLAGWVGEGVAFVDSLPRR